MSHTTPHPQLAAAFEAAQAEVKIGGIYRHFRSGDNYRILGLGLTESNEAPAVIYQRLDDPNKITWVRPLHGDSGWLTPAVRDGLEVARFQLVP